MNSTELLAPVAAAIMAYNAELTARYSATLSQIETELADLETEYQALSLFDPVEHILTGGNRDQLMINSHRIEAIEMISDTLSRCFDKTTILSNGAETPLREQLGLASGLAAATMRGRAKILEAAASGSQVMPAEKASFTANLERLTSVLGGIAGTIGSGALTDRIIATLVDVETPASILEIA